MDSLSHYLSTHPESVIGLIAVGAITLYFLVREFFKMAICCTIILLGLAGYFYYKGTVDLHTAIEKGKTQTKEIYERGKVIYEKGKNLIDKDKNVSN